MTQPSKILCFALFVGAVLLLTDRAAAQANSVPTPLFGFKVDEGLALAQGNAVAVDSKNVYFAWYYLGDLASGRPRQVLYESFPLVSSCPPRVTTCAFTPPIPTVVDVISTAGPVATIGIGVDSKGVPHIVYQDGNGGLKHAELCPCSDFSTVGWTLETVPIPGGIYSSMAVDKNGAVHVVSSSGGAISYTKKSNGVWSTPESIIGPAALAGLSLAVDSGGNPHVLWSDHRSTFNEVVYSSRGSAPFFWLPSNSETVTSDWAEWISLALDSNDQAAVAYWGGPCASELVYVPRQGGFWPPQALDSFDLPACYTNPPPYIYHNVSLAFSPTNIPLISYGFEHTFAGPTMAGGVALANQDGFFFHTQPIFSVPGGFGALNSTSLVVDAAGISHVLFLLPGNCVPGVPCNQFLLYGRYSKANTPAGSVTISFGDPASYGPPITVTFPQVTQAGVTSVSIDDPNNGPAPPPNFETGNPPVYYDLSTTVTFVPPATVCIPYGDVSNPSSMAIMHFENGAWVDRTVSNDTFHHIICANVSSFSPIAIFQSNAPPPTDIVPPITLASVSPQPNVAGWNNSNVVIALNSSDNEPDGSGVKQITLSDTGAQTVGSTVVSGASTSLTISVEGITTITFYGTDNAGNVESPKTLTVMLDKTPPTITSVRTPPPNANGWNNTSVTVSFQCSDALSGLAAGSPPAPTALSSEGAGQSVSGTCTDVAGNAASATVSNINIDKTPPTVACSASPNILWPPNNKLVPIDVSVNVSDALSGSGGFTLVSVSSNEPDSGQGDIQGFLTGTASTSGQLRAQRLGSGTGRVYTLTYTGSDRAGNTALCTTTVSVPHDQGN
jgi:hypothetical protein